MKVKKEYIILILVIVGLIFYLTMKSTNDHGSELPRPAKVDNAKINRIVISQKGREALTLAKKDEKWFVDPQGYPADSVKVRNMANTIADLTLTALVSESGSYERYGLSGEKKITVEAFADGAAVRNFDIGEAAPTSQHTFVLLKGDTNVYHARGHLKRTFEHTIDDLRDKTVFDLSRESITEIALQKGERILQLTKTELPPKATESAEEKPETATPPSKPKIEWRDAKDQIVDKGTVDRLLGSISRMNCDGYMEDSTKAGLKAATWTITLKDDQGEHAISVYVADNPEAEKIPATATANPYPFVLNKGRVESLEKSIDKLLGIEEKK